MINLRTSARFLLMLAAQLLIFTGGGCKKDEGPTTPVITPITEDLFPLVAGRRFVYTGFLVDTNSVETPVASSVGHYQAVWNVLAGPAGTWLIQDSTTVGTTTATRFFQITKDTTTGDFSFRQTLGPFYRAIHATYTDTAVWIGIARPSMGIGVVWTAFDATVTSDFRGDRGEGFHHRQLCEPYRLSKRLQNPHMAKNYSRRIRRSGRCHNGEVMACGQHRSRAGEYLWRHRELRALPGLEGQELLELSQPVVGYLSFVTSSRKERHVEYSFY
ncbi:MAG: hypothetical protein E6K56_09895 [Ignavibacteria bacterium]|nr:MAG: hypothetical protein E6K56_09895 [Ignavibacteria bacterium]